MEQFSLKKWLQDKSRKVITRNGMEAEIIHDSFPLVAIINGVAYNFDHDGKFQSNKTNHKYDLFFADEELTELEKAIYQYICTIVTACDGEVYGDKELKPIVKEIAKELRDLAIKEIEKEDWRTPLRAYKNGYDKATKDVLEWIEKNIPCGEMSYGIVLDVIQECKLYFEREV